MSLGKTGASWPVGTWAVLRLFPSPPAWSQVPMLLICSLAVNTCSIMSIKNTGSESKAYICQAVSKMQSCREWVSFHPGVSRMLQTHGQSPARLPICCGFSKSREDHLRATKVSLQMCLLKGC